MKRLYNYRITFLAGLFALVMTACSTGATEENKAGGFFEGIVTYQVTYEGNEAYVSSSTAKTGKTSHYCFRQGNYYQDYDGQELEYTLYLKEPNFYLTKYKGFDTLDLIDCSREMASKHDIHEIRSKKTHEMILGKDCQVISVGFHEDKSFLKNIDFYYNPHVMPIDAKWEAHNPMYNLSAVFERTHALPLKIVYDYGELRIIYTAIEIKDQDLESFFLETDKQALKKAHRAMN